MKFAKYAGLLMALWFCFSGNTALGCTIFAAQGSEVSGGGSMIVKNRDFKPSPQRLKLVKEDGYAYYGLFSERKGGREALRAGVNEHGLAVVSAMASSLGKDVLRAQKWRPFMRHALAECASVDEVLQRKELFLGPQFIIIADAKEIACIEVALHGKYKVTRRSNSHLYHTNRYIADEYQYLNRKSTTSADARYQRIEELLSTSPTPYSQEDFIAFSQDRNGGPNNSLWRVGSSATGTQPMATFLVNIKPDGDFSVWVKYRPEVKDKGNEQVVELTKDQIFGSLKKTK